MHVCRLSYSFQNLCLEDPTIALGDETEKVFLCTEGSQEDISAALRQFLFYVAGRTTEGVLAKKLEDAVEVVRQDPEGRSEHKAFMEEYFEDAIAEAVDRIVKATLDEATAKAKIEAIAADET